MRHTDYTDQSNFDASAEQLSADTSPSWIHAAYNELFQDRRKRSITNDDFATPPEVTHSNETTESEHPQIRAAHDKLEELAKLSIQDEKLLQSFAKNMQLFENRALSSITKLHIDSGMAPSDAQTIASQEIIGTYKEIAQLLESTSTKPVSQQRKIEIAQQILSQAATPTSIDQGCHSTCNVTTVEVRTYTRSPSLAASLVSAVALTGQYTSTEGTTVKLGQQSLKPDPEAETQPTPPGSRSFASQLFQVAAVNLWYAKHQPYLRYEQHSPTGKDDSGERLVNYVEEKALWNPGNTPELSCYQMADIGRQITGRADKGWILTATEKQPNNQDALTTITTEQQLATEIKAAASTGKFPIVIEVSTDNESFGGSSDQTNRQNTGRHVVTVCGYKDGEPLLIFIDNQWGPSSDRLTASTALPVSELFQAMKGDSK